MRILLAGWIVLLLSTVDLRGLMAADHAQALWSLSHPATARLTLATALFVAAALTDALDGALARRWDVITRFGRVIDPLADKLLILGVFTALAGPAFQLTTAEGVRFQATGVAPWMVVVILARELLVTSIRGVYEAEGIDFSAGPSGKIKMILQSIAAPLILLLVALAAPLPGTFPRAVILWTCWLTVIATAISAVPYVHRAVLASAERARARAAGRTSPDLGPPSEKVEIPTTRSRKSPYKKRRRRSRN